LSGKKARYFDILFFMIPVNEFDRIIADDMNKVFLFSIIDTVQANCGFLLSGLFPAGQNNSGCCNPMILLKSTPKKVQNQMKQLGWGNGRR
jgi:hypothetical protein